MKKLNKLFAILVAMAMVLSLGVVSAFAADGVTGQTGTEEAPATAKLYKVLYVPTGTSVDETFTVKFVEDTDDENKKAIDDKDITIKTANKGTSETAGIDRYINFITLSFEDNFFPEPGVYTYVVSEKFTPDQDSTNTVTSAKEGNITKTTVYDTKTYTVKIGVATKADGETTYVQAIGVYEADGTKVPAGEPSETGEPNGFKFENKMSKKVSDVTPEGSDPTKDPDAENDDTALYVGKKVTGDTAPEGQAFSFRLNIKAPANVPATETRTYNAQIIDKDGNKQSDVTVTTGTAKDFQLQDGWRLVFTGIDVGASYTVTEADYPAYKVQSGEITEYTYINDAGQNGTTIDNKYTKNDDPGTGLSIANLPFIVLALVAVGGLVAYVIVRRKSEDNA